MKKIFSAVAALAAVMFVGCTTDITEENVVVPSGDATTITLGIDDSRTALGDLEEDGSRKVFWNEGDQIVANGVTSATTTLSESKSFATFTFEDPNLVAPYNIFYPAACYKDATTVTLPAVREGAKSVLNAPMAGVHDGENATSLHHLTAVVRLQVKLPAESAHEIHNLLYVEVRGGNDEQMSGDFTIDYAAATLTPASTADADKVVTAECGHVLSSEEAHDVFIVVPAGEYTKGLQFRLIDRAGHYMDLKSGAKALNAGDILAMPVVEFAPTGTQIGVEIKSAEELVAFAKAYNAGDYWELSPFVIHLTEDIVFDDATNAAWEPIGNIFGADNKLGLDEGATNYFHGHFDGNGHSIKNWVSSRPLFAYTGGGSVVENVVIDESCTLTANYKDEVVEYGAFVGYHRGNLINCHLNANLTATGTWAKNANIGGLVGRLVVGVVDGCSVSGDVTMDKEFICTSTATYFGGVVGWNSNGDGVINDTNVYGNITHRGGSTYIAEGSSNGNDSSLYFGGIIGLLNGTVTNCHLYNATANTKTFFFGNYVHGGDTAENTNRHYRNMHVGGIAGNVSEIAKVSNCTNYSAVTLNQFNGNSINGSNDCSRYLNFGGIVGYLEGKVENCTMYSSIINRSSCLQQFIGGVVGNAQASATISNCANEGSEIGSGTTSLGYYQARNGNIGGVIGISYSTALSQLTNKANLSCSRINANAGTTWKMGGIVGLCNVEGEIDGQNEIVNYGTISNNHGTANNSYTTLGGIAGESLASWKNVKNTGIVFFAPNSNEVHKNAYVGGIVGYANGNISLTSVTNEGNVYLNGNKGNVAQVIHYNLCVGGILGTNNDSKAVTITSSTNSGTVAITNLTQKANGRSTAVGGIVGALTNGASSISNCENTGCVSNANFNNVYDKFIIRADGGAPNTGGIAGIVYGTAEDRIAVTNCTSNKTTGNDSGLLYQNVAANSGNRAVAGLIGAAQYADITSCNCSTYVSNANSSPVAGLVVLLSDSSLENCTLSNSKIEAGGTGVPYIVGLVAHVTKSTVSNNTIINTAFISVGKTATIGLLAGLSDADSSFTDNKVSGTIDGTEATLSSVMVVSGSPTVTGTTLYTE